MQPGKPYDKARTALAERAIQLVRGMQKTLVDYVESKIPCRLEGQHPLKPWAMVHAAWPLNRFHVSSTTGCTAFMSLRGRPYKARICWFAQVVFALDALQAKYSAQWRRRIWLGKDEDIVAVSEKEVIKSKAVRKTSEEWDASSILALEIHPWDLKKVCIRK